MGLQPGQHVGPYRLLNLLGAGGMGEVYAAVHDRIARKVAIKVLFPDLARSAEVTGRFLNEARAVNIVHHPGLVEIFDYGQLPDGTTYIVMEFLPGVTLSQHLESHGGKLAEEQVLCIGQQIAQALEAAHRKGIIHRDLKPANVMLVPDSGVAGGLRAKLLDFGIAKVSRENQEAGGQLVKTSAGAFLGSPLYMSPEQCHGAEAVTPASDVYSFGALLYCLLTGEPPFRGTSAADVVGMHLFVTPVPVIQRAAQTTPELAALVDAMLRKKPAERPTMKEVVRKLSLLLWAHQPAQTSWLTFRRRVAIGVVCSLVGLLAVGVAVNTGGPSNRAGKLPRSCNSAGFCREPQPDGITRLRAVVAFSPQDVWACGDPGSIVHFDGKGWRTIESGLGNRLHHLFGFSPRDVWAVGDNGTVARYDGQRWNRLQVGSSAYLTNVWGVQPSDLWVVGKVQAGNATLLHYDGQGWDVLDSGTRNNLLSLWGSQSDDVWAAGNLGTLLHYDGKRWQAVPAAGTTQKLTGLWGTSDKDVWAAGHGGALLHFAGARWEAVPVHTTHNLNYGWSRSPSDVWVVGDQGTILHYDGHAFTSSDSGVNGDLDHVTGLRTPDSRDLWIVGSPAMLLRRSN